MRKAAPARCWFCWRPALRKSEPEPLSGGPVSHPVGRALKRLPQPRGQVRLDAALLQCLGHACHPLVSLCIADRKRQVPRAQHRMAEAVDVVVGPAEPAAQRTRTTCRASRRAWSDAARGCPGTAVPGPSGRKSGRPAPAPRLRRRAVGTALPPHPSGKNQPARCFDAAAAMPTAAGAPGACSINSSRLITDSRTAAS